MLQNKVHLSSLGRRRIRLTRHGSQTLDALEVRDRCLKLQSALAIFSGQRRSGFQPWRISIASRIDWGGGGGGG